MVETIDQPVPSKAVELLALALAMAFPTVMAWTYFVALAAPVSPGGEANPALQIAYAAGKVAQFSFPVLFLFWFDRGRLRFVAPDFSGLSIGLAFGVAVAAGMLALHHFWLRPWLIQIGTADQVRVKVQEFGAAAPVGFLALATFLSLIHSFLEEYYWRWFVFGRLERLIPFGAANALASLAFMAHHVIVLYVYLPGHFVEAVVPFSLCIAAGGAVWAWLFHRTRSIYAPWLSHLIVDVAIMWVGYDLLFA